MKQVMPGIVTTLKVVFTALVVMALATLVLIAAAGVPMSEWRN